MFYNIGPCNSQLVKNTKMATWTVRSFSLPSYSGEAEEYKSDPTQDQPEDCPFTEAGRGSWKIETAGV